MKSFDLKNIKEEDIFIGDIFMVEIPLIKLIKKVRESNTECKDLSPFCFTVLAKKEAILIKVDENKYVDIDGIKSNKDIDVINELLNNNSTNNNILSIGTLDPYVGELFIGINTLCNVKNSRKILEKKLNTLN